jgi:hypothetical protein
MLADATGSRAGECRPSEMPWARNHPMPCTAMLHPAAAPGLVEVPKPAVGRPALHSSCRGMSGQPAAQSRHRQLPSPRRRCRPPRLCLLSQIGLASAVSAIIGKYLTGSFPLDDSGTLTVSCALSMRSASVCTAGYASTAASILLSFAMVALQVRGRCWCGRQCPYNSWMIPDTGPVIGSPKGHSGGEAQRAAHRSTPAFPCPCSAPPRSSGLGWASAGPSCRQLDSSGGRPTPLRQLRQPTAPGAGILTSPATALVSTAGASLHWECAACLHCCMFGNMLPAAVLLPF